MANVPGTAQLFDELDSKQIYTIVVDLYTQLVINCGLQLDICVCHLFFITNLVMYTYLCCQFC